MGEAAAEAGGYLREVERKVGQRPPVPGAVPKEQGSMREMGSPRSIVLMSAFMAAT